MIKAAAGGRKVGKLTICKEGAWFTGNQAAHPGVPGRGAEGVRELLWAAAGRRGASRNHLRPSGHHFFNFCGIAGRADRIFGQNLAPEESFSDKSCRVRGRLRVLIT